MPIKRISVENFKSFSELDVELSPFNVVIGSNAAGKSNFISIFKFLRDIARQGLVNAIALQGGPEYIRNAKIGRLRDLVFRIVYEPEQQLEILELQDKNSGLLGVKSSTSSYEFSIRFHEAGNGFDIMHDRLVIGCEVVECQRDEKGAIAPIHAIGTGKIQVTNTGGTVSYSVDIPAGCPISEKDVSPTLFRKRTMPEKTLLLETQYAYPLPHVEKFFDRIAVYDIDPKLSKKGVVITGKSELEEDAGNLALVIKAMIENPEKKRKLTNLIRDVLPFVEDFSVQKFMDVSFILTMRERYAKSQDLPASSLSDGTITLFALIIALYFENKPFVIIEEPVNHIHPFLISRVISMMKEASAHKQLMVTTHSTEVVKHTALEDILLISRDSEGFSIVSRPADKEEVRTFLENEIGIDELYVQNLLGI
jgi:predicted ATPase